MILLGSVRPNRAGEKVAHWVEAELKKLKDIEIDYADAEELDLPLFDEPVPPAYSDSYINPKGTAWAERVGKANGFIFVTAEYNHGYTAAIKNMIDWVGKEWAYKPASFVSYGAMSGGVRAVEQLKQVVVQLNMVPLNETVIFSNINQAFSDDGRPVDDGASRALGRLLTELTVTAKKLAT